MDNLHTRKKGATLDALPRRQVRSDEGTSSTPISNLSAKTDQGPTFARHTTSLPIAAVHSEQKEVEAAGLGLTTAAPEDQGQMLDPLVPHLEKGEAQAKASLGPSHAAPAPRPETAPGASPLSGAAGLATFAEILLAVAIPDAIIIGVYTSIGAGPYVFSLVADDAMDMLGNVLALVSAFFLALLFIFDWNRLMPVLKVVLGLIQLLLFFAATTLKGMAYPWAGGLVCLLASVMLLSFIRAMQFSSKLDQGAARFYWFVDISYIMCAWIVLAVFLGWMAVTGHWWADETMDWLAAENEDVYTFQDRKLVGISLDYTRHCSKQNNFTSIPDDVQAKIILRCKKANTVWFLQWVGPCIVVMCNFVCAGFCALFGGFASFHPSGKDAKVNLRIMLQRCMCLLTLMLACMYCSLYVSGAAVKLGSGLLCLGALGTTLLLGWMYFEIDHQLIKEVADSSPFAMKIVNAAKSDWIRAIPVGGLHIFIPFMAFLDMSRQDVRRWRGTAADKDDTFTPGGRQLVNELKTWKWVSIFQKVILLAEVFIVMIVGSKFTFVFFSWLNVSLSDGGLSFGMVCGVVFASGVGMFMCPIVPGSAVYLFAGVVLGAQAQREGEMGLWPGTLVACVVGSVAKALACCGQYLLGYAAGKFVKVQQFVGVDKVPTRAMEQVLKEKGVKPGKVCVLVAGPDFPVSMLCGILKINIPQMLLGTSPVILVSIVPQTIVGALLTNEGDDLGMISTGVTGFAAAAQVGATLVYIYFIMRTVERDGEKLAQPRAEHAAVAELTKNEETYVQAYKIVTDWLQMQWRYRLLILSSVSAFLLGGFMIAADFMLADKLCFRPFSITDRIGDSFDLGGLGGNAFNLVMPAGWASLSLAFLGFVLNFVFGKFAAASARNHLVENVGTLGASVVGKAQMVKVTETE